MKILKCNTKISGLIYKFGKLWPTKKLEFPDAYEMLSFLILTNKQDVFTKKELVSNVSYSPPSLCSLKC